MLYQINKGTPFSLLHVVKIAMLKSGIKNPAIQFREATRTKNWLGWTTLHPAGFYGPYSNWDRDSNDHYYGREMPKWNIQEPVIRVKMTGHKPGFPIRPSRFNFYDQYDEYVFNDDTRTEEEFRKLKDALDSVNISDIVHS